MFKLSEIEFKKLSLPRLDDRRTISFVISFSGKVLFIIALIFALKARNNLDIYHSIRIPEAIISPTDIGVNTSNVSTLEKINFIKQRNILGLKEESKSLDDKKDIKKISPLKFRLVGTLITPGVSPIAIIEDTAAKKQDAFEVNESVFDKAKLKEVLPEKIVLDRDGSIETLEIEEGTLSSSEGESGIQSSNGTFTVPEDEVTQALSNLPVLLSQARAVPYFRNGQSIGMRLYAIKAGSLYEKLGLKNSDIIKDINGSAVSDPTKALKLFEDLKSQREIKVQVEREGQDVNLQYQVR